MTLRNRLFLAALLTPVFWLLFVWIFFVSPSSGLLSITVVLGQTLAMAYVCAYCVTLFVVAIRQFSDQPKGNSCAK